MTELHWHDAKEDTDGFKISRTQDLTKQRHHIRVWRAEAGVWSWSMHRHAGELPSGNFQPNRKLAQADAQRWWTENHDKPIISIRIMHLGYPTSFLANTNDRTKTERKSTGPKHSKPAPEAAQQAELAEMHTTAETHTDAKPKLSADDYALAEKLEAEMRARNAQAPVQSRTQPPPVPLREIATHILKAVNNAYPNNGRRLAHYKKTRRDQSILDLFSGIWIAATVFNREHTPDHDALYSSMLDALAHTDAYNVLSEIASGVQGRTQ